MAEEIRALLNDPEKLREQIEGAFKDADENENGHIDRNELRSVYIRFSEFLNLDASDVTDSILNEAMAMLDTDKSGTIEIEEFARLCILVLEKLASDAENQQPPPSQPSQPSPPKPVEKKEEPREKTLAEIEREEEAELARERAREARDSACSSSYND